MEYLAALIFLACFLLATGAFIRYRFEIYRWLRDPAAPSSSDPNARRKKLTRDIEDYQDELARLDTKEQNKE